VSELVLFNIANRRQNVAVQLRDLLRADSQMSIKLLQATPSCGRKRGADIELATYQSTALSFLYPLPTEAIHGGDSSERPRVIILCRTCDFPVSHSRFVHFSITYLDKAFLGRVPLVAQRPIMIKLSRGQSVGPYVRVCIGLFSALWKNN